MRLDMSRYIDVPFRTDPLQDWQLVLEFTHVLVVARSAKCTRMQWTYRIFARYVKWDGFCTRWMSFGNQEIKWQLSSCLQHCSVNWDPCDIASWQLVAENMQQNWKAQAAAAFVALVGLCERCHSFQKSKEAMDKQISPWTAFVYVV